MTMIAALLVADAGGSAPEGELIAFADTRVDWELVVRRLDGRGEHRIASDLANQLNPSLSPDGEQVAFESAGVDLLLLQCSPQLEEMERFAEEVIRPSR